MHGACFTAIQCTQAKLAGWSIARGKTLHAAVAALLLSPANAKHKAVRLLAAARLALCCWQRCWVQQAWGRLPRQQLPQLLLPCKACLQHATSPH
jgi:hypothetical protein